MVLGAIGDALGAIGAVGGILGGGGDTKTAPVLTPMQQLPQGVQDMYNQTYLNALNQNFQQQYPESPRVRAQAPTSIFDSPELYNLQLMNDKFYGTTGVDLFGAGSQPPAQPAATVDPGQMQDLQAQMMGMQYVNSQRNPNTNTGFNPGTPGYYGQLGMPDYTLIGRLLGNIPTQAPTQDPMHLLAMMPKYYKEDRIKDLMRGLDVASLTLPIHSEVRGMM